MITSMANKLSKLAVVGTLVVAWGGLGLVKAQPALAANCNQISIKNFDVTPLTLNSRGERVKVVLAIQFDPACDNDPSMQNLRASFQPQGYAFPIDEQYDNYQFSFQGGGVAGTTQFAAPFAESRFSELTSLNIYGTVCKITNGSCTQLATTGAKTVTVKTGNSNSNSNGNSNSNSNQINYNGVSVTVGDYDKEVGPSLSKLINADSVPDFIASLIKGILLVISIIAVIVILIGAFRMAMSQGNAENIAAGKRTITWAILGLVLALLSYSIVAILQTVLGV